MSDMIRQRLDQIDGKLDKLSDAVSRLAAVRNG